MPDSCATCVFYQAAPELPDSAFVAEFAMIRGTCRAHPAYVQRWPTDWCGEHRERSK